jgi:hypothetical protein
MSLHLDELFPNDPAEPLGLDDKQPKLSYTVAIEVMPSATSAWGGLVKVASNPRPAARGAAWIDPCGTLVILYRIEEHRDRRRFVSSSPRIFCASHVLTPAALKPSEHMVRGIILFALKDERNCKVMTTI